MQDSISIMYWNQCCKISAMADIGGGFLALRHDRIVKDGSATEQYADMAKPYVEVLASAMVCHRKD